VAVEGASNGDTAQGSLRLIPPADLLEVLARRRFTGRLVLMTAATPRRIVAVHLQGGRPELVVGTGMPHGQSMRDEAFRARQVLLEALGWSAGAFRIEESTAPLPPDAHRHELGDVSNLLLAARERARTWPKLTARLPAPFGELWVAPRSARRAPLDDPARLAVRNAVTERMPLSRLAARSGLDDHVVVAAVLDLAASRDIAVGTEDGLDAAADPAVRDRVASILDLAGRAGGSGRTLKITVLSWDSRTCFRTVQALMGRDRPVPDDIESQPRYQVLHETLTVDEPFAVEVLAFRADAFEPAFAAPMVHDCHVFLVVTDLESGHVWGGERPLVERLNQIREMFSGTSFAGRVTIGAGAVTDPGCDVLLPELGRYVGWSDVAGSSFLGSILGTLCDRLGVEITPA
jgi:hypothetical protein